MILYSSSAREFCDDVDQNRITDRIREAFWTRLGFLPGQAEQRSWGHSMQFMERALRLAKIPADCGVLIEFGIPATSKRIDFLISGQDAKKQDHFVIVELKQWETAKALPHEDVVETVVGGGLRSVTHPSYQAWSYRQFLADMNEAVYTGQFSGHACAYLHNYRRGSQEPLLASQYRESVKRAPLFFKDDHRHLQDYIHRFVGSGAGINTLYLIEKGRVRPSKKLMDHVAGLFHGHQEFILLDEQKVTFETILSHSLDPVAKTVILVSGGPGTGKSVLSMNVFGQILQSGKNVRFVAPNAAFRTVMMETLARQKAESRTRIQSLFGGSSSFHQTPADFYDVLVVDEAHRLKDKSAYMYQGENQVEDVIRAAKVTVLFLDDSQQIRPSDIGSSREVRRLAKTHGARLIEMSLSAQFRCAGAEGFINWMSDVLQIERTGNVSGWDQESFDFRLMDSPNEVRREIRKRESQGYKARLLAGYAWRWTSEKQGNTHGQIADVRIDEHHFAMPWNPKSSRAKWAILPDGIDYIGCIHTSQGLEFDHVGVIIGNDLRFDPKHQRVYADGKEYFDRTGKQGIKENPAELNRLVRNIYKVLCSRGMKGCYIYCRDEKLQDYLRQRLQRAGQNDGSDYRLNAYAGEKIADADGSGFRDQGKEVDHERS